jgi:signal transduction histidine kinase
VKTGDELEMLADEFNRMSTRLEEAYTGLEHKVAERTQELVTLNRQLEAANRLKSQFLANVSHELRTPMNGIIGFTRLVMRKTDGQIPALQHNNLQKVLISADHLLSLINGLLDLSKIEAGHMEIFPTRFDLKEVIQVAAATVEPMLKPDRVRFVVEIEPDLPALYTDRDKLKQIILNLLSNAAKFTDDGVVKVSAWQTGDRLRLAVSDTGIGMPREALDYIFEEFRQVDMSSTRKHGGTGLGLAIVRKLAHLLGGDVCAESDLGKGSTFTVTLPLAITRSATPAAR